MIKRKKPIAKISKKRLEELGGKMPFSTIFPKGKSTIKKVSDKTKVKLADYKTLRTQFLKTHTKCELHEPIRKFILNGGECSFVPVCSKKAVEIHHAAGRFGGNLTDVDTFKAACDSSRNLQSCHHWVTIHSREAIQIGLSISKFKL